MTIISAFQGGSGDAYARLVEGLRRELGCTEVGALAQRIFECEKLEFHWDARVRERYLGHDFSFDCDDEDDGPCELARVAFVSSVAARWHAGVCLVDGEGCATGLLWVHTFDRQEDATDAFLRAH